MKVFIAGTSLLSSYGGPAYSVSRLADALADKAVTVGLWSPDGSALTASSFGNSHRVAKLGGTIEGALEEFGLPDIVHDNGLWLRHNHAIAAVARKRGIPRVVSTRGMLEPWAIQHKRWKKTVAWRLYQKRDLSSAALHHATSETEAANLRAKELGAPVCVVANGIDLPQRADRGADPRDGIMTAVFLGRIYPVKGLPMLIEAWRRAMPKGWRLVIAGPDEAGHKSEVERAVAGAGLGAVVSFRGPVGGEEKRRLMSEADLFVLPTHSESFGLAIAEALSFGLPVLTTTAAPWPLLEQENCGWRVTPDADSLANGLSHATSLDRSALGEMGMRGRDIMGSRYRWDSVADQFLEQYERISG